MHSRFTFRVIGINSNERYEEILEDRGVSAVRQYTTPELVYPSPEEIAGLATVGHIWSLGDRLYKLAHFHYGSADLWWVIAWFNQIPLETQLNAGDVIDIPFPLERILRILEV